MSYHALGDASTGTLVTGAINVGGALIGGIVKGADARTGGGPGPAADPTFTTVPSFITPDATAPSSALPGWAVPVAAAAGIGIVGLVTFALLKKKSVAKNRRRVRYTRNGQAPSLDGWKRLDDAAWAWDRSDGTRYMVMRQERRSPRRKRPAREGYVLLVLRPARFGMSASSRDIRFVDASDGHEEREADAVAWFASPEAAAAAVPCAH